MLNLFLKKSPFIRLILPLIAGICLGMNLPDKKLELFLAALVLLICFVGLSFWLRKSASYRYRHLSGILGLVMFFFWASLYVQLRMPRVLDVDGEGVVKLRLIENIGETDKNHKYEAQLLSLEQDSLEGIFQGKGVIYLSGEHKKSQPNAGDVIYARGWFIPFSKPDTQFDFDYSGYLRNQRISFRFLVQDHSIATEDSESIDLFILSARLKEHLNNTFISAGIPESQLAILNALFLGDKSKLSYEQKVSFSNAGAMHLLAVSGLHAGIIYMLLITIISSLGIRKNSVVSACIVITFLWIYAFITGFSPSVLRASLMLTILETGRVSRQKTGIFNLLGASMFIILVIEPLSVFNIGFWLSHSAVAAIVCFYPKINSWFMYTFPPFRWLWSLVSVSLAAQIGTLPLCIYAFHGFPLYFLITNILLIPVVTPIILLAISASLFSFSSLALSLLIPPLDELLTFMEQTALWIDSLPYSMITNLYISGFQLVCIYVSIVLLLVYFDHRFIRYLKLALGTIVVVFASMHLRNYHLPDEVLYVANIKGKSVVNHFGPGTNTIYTNEALTEKEVDFAFSGIWAYYLADSNYSISLMNHKQNTDPVVKLIGNQSVAIVPHHAMWDEQAEFDIVVLLGKPKMTAEHLSTSLRVQQLVIPNGWKWYDKRKWLKAYSDHIENVHNVSDDGVLIKVSGNPM
ncbi:ComEC/Rec2 family competence protein [Carboxylicivirga sp. RSCT41]|uniref:ComEC/Rec2 family competence protein n=1 Tax=Carboxylicivirga agarovorans TaxID=3417570 RepID=UPI003D340C9B